MFRPARASSVLRARGFERSFFSSVNARFGRTQDVSMQPSFGQALHRTHPHLLHRSELTPGISSAEYAQRRESLARKLPGNSIALLAGSSLRYMRGVAFYDFRQNANMFYLTGLNEPDTAMIMRTDSSSKGYSMHLFMQPKDETEEMWNGYRSGLAIGKSEFGADEVHNLSTLQTTTKDWIKNADNIYFDTKPTEDLLGSRWSDLKTVIADKRCIELSPLVQRLRINKSDAEIALMRRVGQISGRAYVDAMMQPWKTESALQAKLRYNWIKHGAEREGYVPVVTSGARAHCIHYTQNNQTIEEDELIFVDAGAELGGYLTDISRAWPASGKFSEPQKDLYQAVLNVEKACIKMCTADSGHSLQTIHKESIHLLKMELRNLNFDLVEGDVERDLYPHRVGHHIGLEIHDCSTHGGYESLAANQTITIEPGCYVPDDEQWPKHFRGLALRIEDSIAVGQTVPTILSVEAVKEIVDIEALRST